GRVRAVRAARARGQLELLPLPRRRGRVIGAEGARGPAMGVKQVAARTVPSAALMLRRAKWAVSSVHLTRVPAPTDRGGAPRAARRRFYAVQLPAGPRAVFSAGRLGGRPGERRAGERLSEALLELPQGLAPAGEARDSW